MTTTGLTVGDRGVIADARELAGLAPGPRALRAYTGQHDSDVARAAALERAQRLLGALVAIIARLAPEDPS
jgi:hypothetical protein